MKSPAGCFRFELLDIRLDSLGRRRYRVRVTNQCASPLLYSCIQLPNGVAAVSPGNDAVYPVSGSNTYAVRNPNASPFHSLRFKALTGALSNGQSDIFEYTLPQQSAPDYIRVYTKLADGTASEAHLNTFNCPVLPWPGIADRNADSFDHVVLRVWPNPNDGQLLLDRSAWPEQTLLVRVMNAQGQLVFERQCAAGPDRLPVALPGNLANGLYYLSVAPVSNGQRRAAAVRFVLNR